MDKEEIIAQAKDLRQEEKLDESEELLLTLLEEYPDDPQVLFEVGGAYDVMGLESEAIPYYQRAIDEGLEGTELLECLICLGITQRVIGEFQEAVDALEEAVNSFPDDNSSKAFLALAYYSNQQHSEAVQTLLDLLLTTTNDEQILSYADTLDFYKDNLDEIWDE